MRRWFGPTVGLPVLLALGAQLALGALPSGRYDFETERSWLTMPDGVRLAVSYFRPKPQAEGEKFPALFEFLPYRKDDQFFRRDYPIYSYFARHGYVCAKVDIRGTGSSEGVVPPREYSEIELADALEVIEQLSKAPWSNGRIGMWGISWGGFNAIQVAMKRPAALKAILAMDATDDLYHDDVHFIDGIFHVDEYELSIDHDLALPQWPDYRLDEAYFENRFNRSPWFLTYLKQQLDGEFWRRNSLRWQYDSIQIPVYLVGGLLDGYRDSVPRMLENMDVPMKGVVGPWNHAFPDDGVPGPNYEWRHEAVRWWDHWLKDLDTGILEEPRFTVFVRAGHRPDPNLEMTPGHWRGEDWPIKGTQWQRFYLGRERALKPSQGEPGVDFLKYVPSYGEEAGFWWGEPTGDMRRSDAGSLVYDSRVLESTMEIIGFPKVRLRTSVDASLAHWVVRLEDIHPDGTVSLVTGGALNGAQRESRLAPSELAPGTVYDLEFDLHFTTWTFEPGHRVRVAVSNTLFPMFWPSPFAMTMQLHLGNEATSIHLPVVPTRHSQIPHFRPPEAREPRPDAQSLPGRGWPAFHQIKVDRLNSTTSVHWEGESNYEIEGRRYFSLEKTLHQASDRNPAQAYFEGEARHRLELEGRILELQTQLQVRSDQSHFHVDLTRSIFENGQLVRTRTWAESIGRRFQ